MILKFYKSGFGNPDEKRKATLTGPETRTGKKKIFPENPGVFLACEYAI